MRKAYKAKVILMIFIIIQMLNTSIVFSENDILTPDERAFLNELGEIQMIVDDDYAPISHFDIQDKEHSGIAVEAMKQV